VNHIWLRHFGQGIVASPNDFGANGRPPSHPALLDWLAAELMANNWSMKEIHKLIVMSSTYRMASTQMRPIPRSIPTMCIFGGCRRAGWKRSCVRDNLLYWAAISILTMGGPEIDHKLGLTSKRRSVYLRTAAEKEVEFLKLFDQRERDGMLHAQTQRHAATGVGFGQQ